MSREQNADWHLLYGLLALQNGLITRQELVSAFAKWTTDKSSRIDRILEIEGVISPDAGDALRHLVSIYVQRQDGDPRNSLQRLSGSDLPTATEELNKLDDSDLYRSLAAVLDRQDQIAAPSQSAETGVGRFRILKPLAGAKGGMGEISVAVDEELGRHVALKQILTDKADHASYRQKFQIEAEVTGNLEHPGIVPIYGLGTGADGRPYYAMRLVKGDNLSVKIRQFHNNGDGSVDYNSVEFRGLVDRLVDVAQAIRYAHSRGVLHRDLKPGNILVGEYGETLVIDWGLARLPQTESQQNDQRSNDERTEPLQIRSGSHADATVQGQALGTLGYAPPEQLSGHVELITERSDVYGLGAILYQILVGRTPVSVEASGRELDEVIRETVEGHVVAPRSVRRAVPKGLSAICMKALKRDPADRYASVEAFVAEIEHWQADQPIMAAPDSLADHVMRLARRYRTAALATTVMLLGIAIVTGAALVLVNRARVNEAAARLNETMAREKAEALADDNARLARRNQTVVDAFIAAFRSADPELAGVTSKMTAVEVLEQALAQMERNEALADDELAKATLLAAVGTSLQSLGDYRKAIAAFKETLRLQTEQLGAEHLDTLVTIDKLATGYRATRQLELAIPLYETTYERRKAQLGPDHPETLISMTNLATGYHAAGRQEAAQELFEEAFRRTKTTLGPEHEQTLSSMGNLALSYRATGRVEEAIPLYEEVLGLMTTKLGPEHPQTLTAMNNLALALQTAGRPDAALPIYQSAFKGRQAKLGTDHPKTLISMTGLATCYQAVGSVAEALPLFEASLRLAESKLGPAHPLTISTRGNLAFGYQAMGRLAEALALHEQAMTLTKAQLGPAHPLTLTSMDALSAALIEDRRFERAAPIIQDWMSHLDLRGAPTALARGRTSLAVCLLELDQLPAAIEAATAAIDLKEIRDIERSRAETVIAFAQAQQGDAEAEARLLKAYQELRQQLPRIIPHQRWYVARAAERVIRFYEAANEEENLKKWQAELAEVNAEVERLRTLPLGDSTSVPDSATQPLENHGTRKPPRNRKKRLT